MASPPRGERIIDLIRDRIISGALPPDTVIRQDALAEEFGISKIPLREAFARLEQDGLIVSRVNRGFFVRPMSAEEAYDVFDLRLKIEPDAAGLGALAATPADHQAATDALGALEAAGPASAGALNRAFHIALVRPGGRAITFQTVERLQVIAERYVVKHLEPGGRPKRASAEHHALLGAWIDGKPKKVRRLTTEHIERTLDDLKAQLGGP